MANGLHQLWRQFERDERFQKMDPEARVGFVDHFSKEVTRRFGEVNGLGQFTSNVSRRYAKEAGHEVEEEPKPEVEVRHINPLGVPVGGGAPPPGIPVANPLNAVPLYRRTAKAFEDRLKAIAQNRLSDDELFQQLDEEYEYEVEHGPHPDRPGLVSGIIGSLAPTIGGAAGASALTTPVGGFATAGALEGAAARIEGIRDTYFTELDKGAKRDAAMTLAKSVGNTSAVIQGATAAIPITGIAAKLAQRGGKGVVSRVAQAIDNAPKNFAGTSGGVARFAKETVAKGAINGAENAVIELADIAQERLRGADLSERRGGLVERMAINFAAGAAITGATAVGAKARIGNFDVEDLAGKFAAIDGWSSDRATPADLEALADAGFRDSVDVDKEIKILQGVAEALSPDGAPSFNLRITDENVEGYNAVYHKAANEVQTYVGLLEAAGDTPDTGNPQQQARVLVHEAAHAFHDTVEPETQQRLYAQFNEELATRKGILFDEQGEIHPDVDPQFAEGIARVQTAKTREDVEAGLKLAYREWFAERIMLNNREWAANRVKHADLTGFDKVAQTMRRKIENVGRALGFGNKLNEDFRGLFDGTTATKDRSGQVVTDLIKEQAAKVATANKLPGGGREPVLKPIEFQPSQLEPQIPIKHRQQIDFQETEAQSVEPTFASNPDATPTPPVPTPEPVAAKTPDPPPAQRPVGPGSERAPGEAIDDRTARVLRTVDQRYPKQAKFLKGAIKRVSSHKELDKIIANADRYEKPVEVAAAAEPVKADEPSLDEIIAKLKDRPKDEMDAALEARIAESDGSYQSKVDLLSATHREVDPLIQQKIDQRVESLEETRLFSKRRGAKLAQAENELEFADKNGWLLPSGRFIETDPTAAVQFKADDDPLASLGEHGRAALDWLEQNEPDQADIFWTAKETEAELSGEDGLVLRDEDVYEFMFSRKWLRVAQGGNAAYLDGRPSARQAKLMKDSATHLHKTLIHDLGNGRERVMVQSDDTLFSKRGLTTPGNYDLTRTSYWLAPSGQILSADSVHHRQAVEKWAKEHDPDTYQALEGLKWDDQIYQTVFDRLGWVRVARTGSNSAVQGRLRPAQRKLLTDVALEEGRPFNYTGPKDGRVLETLGNSDDIRFSKRGKQRVAEEHKKNPNLPKPQLRQFAERAAEKHPKDLGEIFERRNDIAFKEPQVLKKGQDNAAQKEDVELDRSLDQLEAKIEDSDKNFEIMDGFENLRRAMDKGDEAKIEKIYEVLSKAGTTIGQQLRQFREFKGKARRVNLMKLVELALQRSNRKLTAKQKTKLKSVIDADLKAKDQLEKLAENYFEHPDSKLREAAAFKAAYNEDRAFRAMQAHVRALLPRSLRQLPVDFLAAIQGNLLTPVSTGRNLEGNYINYSLRLPARIPAAMLDLVASKFTQGRKRTVKLPSFRELGWFLQGSLRGLPKARDAFTLGARNDTILGEAIRGFNPVKSLVEAFTGDLPVDVTTGKVPVVDRLKKLTESIFGMAPEAMLRTLSSMDELAKEGFRAARLEEEVRLRELSEGTREFAEVKFSGASQPHPGREFSGDRAAQVAAEESALKQTFQDKSSAAGIAQSVENAMAAVPVVGPAIRVAYRVAVSPYVRTPINLMVEGMQFAVPMFGFMRGATKAMQGNRREATLSFGSAMAGMVMGQMADWLMGDGLVSAGPENPKTTKMRHDSGMGFFRLNLSGFNRKLAGEDPAYRPGDHTIRLDTLGIMGYVIAVKAAAEQEIDKDPTTVSSVPKAATDALGGLMAAGRFAMNQTMLQGAADGLRALSQGDGSAARWVGNFVNVVTSAAMPNTLMAWNNVNQDLRKETLDRDSAYRTAANVVMSKTEAFKNIVTNRYEPLESLPDKLDLWGRPIKATPEGQNPFVWHMLDIFKTETVRNDVTAMLFRIHQETDNDDFIPSVVPRNLDWRGTKLNLPPEDYADLVKEVQGEKLKVFLKAVQSQRFIKAVKTKPDKAANVLKGLYSSVGSAAKKRWMRKNQRRLNALVTELQRY